MIEHTDFDKEIGRENELFAGIIFSYRLGYIKEKKAVEIWCRYRNKVYHDVEKIEDETTFSKCLTNMMIHAKGILKDGEA